MSSWEQKYREKVIEQNLLREPIDFEEQADIAEDKWIILTELLEEQEKQIESLKNEIIEDNKRQYSMEVKIARLIDIKDCINDLMRCFEESFINASNEIIFDRKQNIYFRLEDVKTEMDLKCKVLEWLSRDAHKGTPPKLQNRILRGINNYLKTDFTKDDMSEIYGYLGNNCNRELCIKYIESGYSMIVLKGLNLRRIR